MKICVNFKTEKTFFSTAIEAARFIENLAGESFGDDAQELIKQHIFSHDPNAPFYHIWDAASEEMRPVLVYVSFDDEE